MASPYNLNLQQKKHFALLVSLILTTPIIFFQAFRFSFPLGYAGMFTLIAESISRANFALPMTVPHYGPGGIPLVYPPFALYLFALALKLGISTWFYLRFAPAIFTALAIIPLYFLTVELVESRVAGVFVAVLAITGPAVYYTHVWSAGVVRGMALFLCLTDLLFYLRSLRAFSWQSFFLAGTALGFVFITHWLYVLFAALVGLACLIAEWKPSRFLIALGILGVALLVAAPWLILIVERHEASTLLFAYSSHRNADFILSLNNLAKTAQFIGDNLKYVTDNFFLTLLALPGFLMLLLRKKFHLPLAFIFILFMGEASFYSQILASMMAGAFSAEMLRLAPKLDELKGTLAFLKTALVILVVICFLFSAATGLSQIASYAPEIDNASLQTASFVRGNTDPNATYLFVGRINEAEWFPYLLDRTPVFAPWGGEWKGTYTEQLDILTSLRGCELQKSWACMQRLQQEKSVFPAVLITPNKRWLMEQIKDTHTWDLIYRGERYFVWARNN
jgi:4-amino-4-deoxy-L-arabinose transferase-like glycosyltransferase